MRKDGSCDRQQRFSAARFSWQPLHCQRFSPSSRSPSTKRSKAWERLCLFFTVSDSM